MFSEMTGGMSSKIAAHGAAEIFRLGLPAEAAETAFTAARAHEGLAPGARKFAFARGAADGAPIQKRGPATGIPADRHAAAFGMLADHIHQFGRELHAAALPQLALIDRLRAVFFHARAVFHSVAA